MELQIPIPALLRTGMDASRSTAGEIPWPWTTPLLIPAYLALGSASVLLVHLVLVSRLVAGVKRRSAPAPMFVEEEQEQEEERETPAPTRITLLGGPTIFAFKLARVAGCIALLGLFTVPSLLSSERNEGKTKWAQLSLAGTFAYTALLSLLSLSPGFAALASNHLTSLLLGAFALFVQRDLVPLVLPTRPVPDLEEGTAVLGAKLGVLFYVGVLHPLLVPRQYVPVDPKNPSPPAPEQLAPLLSLLTYSFMDPLVKAAYKNPKMGIDEMPPLADYDEAGWLVARNFAYLDPYTSPKKRHVFFAFLRVYAKEYVVMASSLIVKMLAKFAAPVGINQLLRYLETGGSSSPARPWFWVLWIFLGPASVSIADHWYLFVLGKTMARTETLVTELVFQHSLRIRVKDEEGSGSSPAQAENGVTEDTAVTSGEAAPNESSSEDEAGSTAVASQEEDASAAPKPDSPADAATEDTTGKNLIGRINNLITNDMNNIIFFPDTILTLLYMPPMVLLCIGFLYLLLGWSAFVGLGVIILLLPVPGYVTKLMQTVISTKMQKTDARVQLVSETMSVIRMIKLFGWERKMNDKIAETREEELTWIWKRFCLEIINGILNSIIPALTMLATYTTYSTVIMKQELNASIVFSSMTVFDTLRDQLAMLFRHLGPMVTAKVSFDRLNDFLHNTELLDSFSEKVEGMLPSSIGEHGDHIGFKNAQFTWSNSPSGTTTPSRRNFSLKIQGEVLFKPDCVNIIVGHTGSGKTSILMALLGEMHYEPTGLDSYVSLPRSGGVAYAAQESWVQNETIKENILFCSPFDADRYNKVIYQCCLEHDLKLFEAGDQTEVGEKGLTLSGGQKARITLARAVYSQAKILLLDDILAALDVHTAKWIIEKCFTGDLMKGRTVLLVTHNVALARPIADYIISMGSEGRIASHGTISETIKANRELAAEIEKGELILQKVEENIDASEPKVEEGGPDGKLIAVEEREEGHVSWSALKLFFDGLGGNHPVLFFVSVAVGLLLTEILLTSQTWFLGYWASQYEDHPASSVHVPFYLGVYGSLFLFWAVADGGAFLIYLFGVLRASRSIHKQLMEAILGTTLRWLDTTPTSRIITRCTSDIGAVDGHIPIGFWTLSSLTTIVIIKLGAVIFFSPVFIGPGLLTAALGGWIGQAFMTAQLPVKRELSNAKAPVLGHFGTVISGLISIRAYGAEQRVIHESLGHINEYIRIISSLYSLNRWVSIRVDIIGSLFSASLAAYLVYFQHHNAADTGFSLNMAVGFSSVLLSWVRLLNEIEVKGNSLERIRGYINIVQEPKPTPAGIPPAYWPASGEIQVNNLSAKYSSDGPKVLQDLTFKVHAGERIGIVGRTGSGKSTLTLSLLRSIFTEGEVYYDGINTSNVNLDALRSSITIIPQIPQLLSGTLRQNLDPFDQYEDAVLHDALQSSGLHSLQKDTDEGKITLDTPISSSGSNLSIGQRQILALARAIVRGSKLLILDEATSAIDHGTDSVIQTSLRERLGGDVTVITVAHRLQTIMDADKIMVLDAGRIVEYDTPNALLNIKDGKLRALVDESGDKDNLYSAAKGA